MNSDKTRRCYWDGKSKEGIIPEGKIKCQFD
jgi:hypothetical protein